jgi:hypothetical protein
MPRKIMALLPPASVERNNKRNGITYRYFSFIAFPCFSRAKKRRNIVNPVAIVDAYDIIPAS